MSIASWLESRYLEVSPISFYRDLFPLGELDERDSMTKGKYCGVAVQVVGKNRAHRFTICDDLEPIEELIQQDSFVIVSPVSYAGKAQSQKNARNLYAICFDLDGLIVDGERQIGLESLIRDIGENRRLPCPTYIVSSGTGVHIYYFLETAIPLFDNVIEQLREFRFAMTQGIWNEQITTLHTHPQFESVTQGFRAVGSICKDGKSRVRAFRTGDKVSVEYLNSFVYEDAKIKNFAYKSNRTLSQAKEEFPDWYERRIVQERPRGTWTCNEGLYEWWLKKIKEGENKFPQQKTLGSQPGHRYFSVMALAIYAQKSGISRERLEEDALGLIPLLDSRTNSEENHFDEGDVMKALEAYDASYITFPRDSIRDLTNIDIQPNKRNGRKQKDHVARITVLRDFDYPDGSWRNKEGRPSKFDEVKAYMEEHPGAKQKEVALALGITRQTVAKHLRVLRERGF